MEPVILKSEIYCGDTLYQAQLSHGELGAIIEVCQPFDNGASFSKCSGWYLSTLLDGGINDSISIDYGQNWNIDCGMRAAIIEACAHIARHWEG